MSDIIKIAQGKRAKLMEEIEARMAEVEKLDNFITFGARLSTEGSFQAAAYAAE